MLGNAASSPDAQVNLDLSSVELSFAEQEDETAAVQPVLASALADPVPEVRPQEAPLPEIESPPLHPLEPNAPRFSEPPPEPSRVQTPERPQKVTETPPKPSVTPSPAAQPVAAVAPRQARVEAPPRPRRNISPDYPKGARLRGEQGDVTLEICVSARGTVEGVSVVVSSGFHELDAAAEKAVLAARFAPAKSEGRAVAATVRLTLAFRLK